MHVQAESEWAVVVGDGLNAIGVVRSLAAGGVRVALLAHGPGEESMRSRRARVRRTYAAGDLVAALERLAAELGGRPVLFLTEEECVRLVSEHRVRLLKHYRFRMADHQTMMALTHKDGVQSLCEKEAMPIPAAVRLREPSDLQQLQRLRYPCVLKPGYKHAGYGARFKKAYTVHSADEAQALYDEIAPVLPDLLVQEWIVGGDDAIHFCLQYMVEGKAAASFVGLKLRAWPPQVGGTASCIAAPESQVELTAMTERFFAAVGLQGMCSMEYKRDSRNGRFYVVEPTVGRTDFQQEVATLNGNNIPLAAYRAECGLPLPQVQAVPLCIWREPTSDRWSEQAQGAHPAFRRHKVVDAYFRLNDPGPWLALQHERVRQRLKKVGLWR